jgi:hypothetical protein
MYVGRLAGVTSGSIDGLACEPAVGEPAIGEPAFGEPTAATGEDGADAQPPIAVITTSNPADSLDKGNLRHGRRKRDFATENRAAGSIEKTSVGVKEARRFKVIKNTAVCRRI